MFDFADIDERAEVAFALETLRLIPKPRETVGTTDGDRTEELELERPRFNPLPRYMSDLNVELVAEEFVFMLEILRFIPSPR